MSALAPENGKYRRSWTIWGAQVVPSQKYKDNYDQIDWGKKDDLTEREDLTSSQHYRIRFKTSGQ